MESPWATDLALATRLADTADALTMSRFRATDLVVSTKPDLTPVTEADKGAEEALRAILAAERPADAVRGEEGADTGDSSRTWVIDPIDGTKNYVRGVPVWATLIALVVDGVPVLGFVSAPALARRWWAATGGGAFTRDVDGSERALRASAVARLEDASFSYSDPVGWDDVAGSGLDCSQGLQSLLDTCWRSRAYGDFWSHLLVAEGAVDVAAEPQLNPWDIAALIPIVVEAGGRCTGYDGSPAYASTGTVSGLSTNGLVHDQAVELLRP